MYNDYPVTAVGNGHVLVYRNNEDIISVRTWSHSSPSLASARGEMGLVSEDGALSGKPVFLRRFYGKMSFTLSDHLCIGNVTDEYMGKNVVLALSLATPGGTFAYSSYPVPFTMYNRLLVSGNARAEINGRVLDVSSDGGCVAFVGGPEFDKCAENADYLLSLDPERAIDEYKATVKGYADSIDIKDKIKGKYKSEIAAAAESCHLAVKTQQDSSGGISAGYPYCLGYVRDQYGAARGLIALGDIPSAISITEFFLESYIKNGTVHNAYGMKMPTVAHIHENDKTEITGYLMLMVLDCLDSLPDGEKKEYFSKMLPLLKECARLQRSQIRKGMLPFNGDETYIAGGMLPRNTLYDGSAEATLLFIEAGERFLRALKAFGMEKELDAKELLSAIEECKSGYEENFIKDGILITNNPDRCGISQMPQYRHGVCEGCFAFGWTEKGKKGRYFCPDCTEKFKKGQNEPENERRVHTLLSVSMMPGFINSEFLSPSLWKKGVINAVKRYIKTGLLPSSESGERATGYDMGLLLISAVRLLEWNGLSQDEREMLNGAKDALIEGLLSAKDQTGTYAEYYDGGRPAGTRYRPWESMINITALIEASKQ